MQCQTRSEVKMGKGAVRALLLGLLVQTGKTPRGKLSVNVGGSPLVLF